VPLLSESPVVLPIHRKILGFAFVGWVFDFYDLMLLSFVIASTTIIRDLHLSAYDVSVLLGTSLGFTAVGGLVGGALADRYGRKPLLMYAISLYCLGTLVAGLSTGLLTILIGRALTGLGVGAEWGVAHALVGETVPPHVRGRFGSLLQSGGVFGRFLATVGGNMLAPWIGWRATFILSALPAIMVMLIRRYMPESDVWLKNKRESPGGTHATRAIAEMLSPALRRVTALAFALTVLNMAAFWFKTIWLPTYFRDVGGLTLSQSSQLFFSDQVGGVFGYVTFGMFADRFGRRPSFFAFSLLKAVGLVMLTAGWGTIGGNQLALLIVMFIAGIGEGNWGGIGPIINELFPTSSRAAALGTIYNVSRGVQFIAPIMITFVAAHVSFGAGIALAAPFALLSGCVVWLLPETKGIRLAGATSEPKAPASSVV
jgi:MFS family permease